MKYIDFLNSSVVSVKIKVIYYIKGKQGIQTSESPVFFTGVYKTISMPDIANSIIFKMFFEDSKGTWRELGNISLSLATNKCYEIFGSETKMGFHEINCTNLRGFNYVYFVNKSSNLAKGVLNYTVDKQSYNEEANNIKKYKEVFLSIPIDATNITFTLYIIEKKTFGKDILHKVLNEGIAGRVPKSCYEIMGKWPNAVVKKIQCPPEEEIQIILKNQIKLCNCSSEI